MAALRKSLVELITKIRKAADPPERTNEKGQKIKPEPVEHFGRVDMEHLRAEFHAEGMPFRVNRRDRQTVLKAAEQLEKIALDNAKRKEKLWGPEDPSQDPDRYNERVQDLDIPNSVKRRLFDNGLETATAIRQYVEDGGNLITIPGINPVNAKKIKAQVGIEDTSVEDAPGAAPPPPPGGPNAHSPVEV